MVLVEALLVASPIAWLGTLGEMYPSVAIEAFDML
jgi:hypothetical protein